MPSDDESILIYWAGSTPDVDSPLLIVEGVDADNKNTPSHYYALAPTLLNTGRSRGADVFVLNFDDGGDRLQTNASVLEGAIGHVNAIRTGPRRMDLIGVSMGGVVARYALADMEEGGRTHDVVRFVSVDAPQQGAVIDRELQDWIAASDPNLVSRPANLTSDAGRQLLVYNAFDRYSPTDHEDFFAELDALNGDGYPHATVENVGVSFGTAAPNADTGTKWLEYDIPRPEPNPKFDIEAGSDISVGGSLLPDDVTEFYGRGFKGFLEAEALRTADPTFIPYTSALDIEGGASAFHEPTLSPSAPFEHNDFPPIIATQILDRLGYAATPPPPVSIQGPATVYAGEGGTWTAFVAFGSGTPSYLWEYRLLNGSGCELDGGFGGSLGTLDGGFGGSVGTLDVPVCQWHYGGTDDSFTRTVTGSSQLEMRVHVTRGGQQRTAYKTVQFTFDPAYQTGNSSGGSNATAPSGPAVARTSSAAAAVARTVEVAAGPNPTRGATAVHVWLPKAAAVSVEVFDALGRRVLAVPAAELGPGAHRVPLDVGILPQGAYVVRVDTGGAAPAVVRLTVLR